MFLLAIAHASIVDCTSRSAGVSLQVAGRSLFHQTIHGSGTRAWRSLRLRAPSGALVPLELQRYGRSAALRPAEALEGGLYTVERRVTYGRDGSQRPLGRAGAHAGWFAIERVEIPEPEPLAPPTDVRFQRSADGIWVTAKVPEGSQLGLEVHRVGLVDQGGVHGEDQIAGVADPGPCSGRRVPMRGTLHVRAVSLSPDGTAVGEAYALPPPREPVPRVWDGHLWALPPSRPVRVDDRALHPRPSACGTRGVLEREVVDLGGPVPESRARLGPDGLYALASGEHGWVLHTPQGTRPVSIPTDAQQVIVHDQGIHWNDPSGRWLLPYDDLQHPQRTRVAVWTRGDRVVLGRDTPVPALADHQVRHWHYDAGQVRLLTLLPNPRRWFLQDVDLDGNLLAQLALPEASSWSLDHEGGLRQHVPMRRPRGALQVGAHYTWEPGEGLIPASPPPKVSRAPRPAVSTTLVTHPDGIEIQQLGCTHDGLGVPDTWPGP